MKRLASIILIFAVVVCAGIGLVGCKNETKIKTYGDFTYSVEYYDVNGVRVAKEESVRSGIIIQGLSDAGEKKEIIVVPEYIDGIKVEELGSSLWFGAGVWSSGKLKKVFIPFTVLIYGGVFYHCSKLEKVILLAHETSAYNSDDLIHKKRDGVIPVFLTSFNNKGNRRTNYFDVLNGISFFYFSNVSFCYNYDNAPNEGYYWIDDCNYGGIIDYIPQNPVREGYTFDGWYKESECINKWYFETDTLPQAQYNEDNEEIYQETKLYAKWIKN